MELSPVLSVLGMLHLQDLAHLHVVHMDHGAFILEF